jgi:hypothetical protein
MPLAQFYALATTPGVAKALNRCKGVNQFGDL